MGLRVFLLNFLLLSEAVFSSRKERTLTAQERLHRVLFENYNKNGRPVKDPSQPVKLSLTFRLIKIYDVNAKKQTMSVVSSIKQEWQDDYLTWNTSVYAGLASITVPPDMIWVPDTSVYNEIENKDHKKTEITTNVVVNSSGTCHWNVPAFIQTMCSIDISFFPLDLQQCSLRFGSLTYSDDEIHIEEGKENPMIKNRYKNGEWQLYKVKNTTNTIWDDSRQHNFSVVEITLYMERNSLYYFIEMLVPCFLISCLTVLGFILPPESGERMSLGMLILLAMTFFQQLTMKMVPLQDFPIISQFFFITSIEIGIALLVTTLTLNFYYCFDRKMPSFLRLIVINYIGRLIRFIPPKDGKDSESSKRSFRSNITNTEMEFDIELNESNGLTEKEITKAGLSESSIGLVNFRFKNNRPSLSTSSSSKAKEEQNVVEDALGTKLVSENPKDWNREWVLASRIIDRFAMYVSFFIGLVTVLAVFLRAPTFWRDKTEMEG